MAVLEDLAEVSEQPLRERFEQKVTEFNAPARKKYTVRFSTGTARLQPNERLSIDTLLAQADTKLYAQKRAKKLRVINP